MKKALKITGIAVGAILLLLIAFALFINFKPMPTYEVMAPDIRIEADSLLIARGEHLAHLNCALCHTGEDGQWIGRLMEKGAFGTIYSANITQHPEAGIGAYTDGELVYLLRTGIARDGHMTMPMMPRLVNMSDEDLRSIIAYLRSDAGVVQPSGIKQPATQYSFLAKALLTFAFAPLPFSEQKIETPDPSDKIAYGKYLVTSVGDCFGCHSADFAKVDIATPENSMGYFGGGNPMTDPETGAIVPSANLTPDPQTGIGAWTQEELSKAIRAGISPKGPLSQAMPRFTNFTDEEIGAIYAYLQSIPPIENDVVAKAQQ